MRDVEEFLTRPYSDRQLAVFVDNDVYDALKNEQDVSQDIIKLEKYLEILSKALFPIMHYANKTVKYLLEAKSQGLNIKMIPKRWLSDLMLPPGHPQKSIVYIAHPVEAKKYFSAADFHRFTFEHKFSEAVLLLTHLGAKAIKVEHVEGWGQEFAATMGANIPKADISGEANFKFNQFNDRHVLFEGSFSGTQKPCIPDSLFWYSHEPTWQRIADGRLNFGLEKFSLSLRYQDNYGVNAKLKAKLEKSGFELGGDFQNHKVTNWVINGSF